MTVLRQLIPLTLAASLALLMDRSHSGLAQAEPLPVDDYWTQVSETASAVAGVAGADESTIRAELDAQMVTWQAINAVQLADGSVVAVDSSYLISLLREEPPDLNRITGYLSRLEAARASFQQSGTAPSLESLAVILARQEFQWQPQAQNPIEEAFWDLIFRILDFFARLLPSGAAGSPIFSFLLPFIAAIILAALIGYALRGFLLDMVHSAELEDDEASDVEVLTAQAALQRAHQVAATGDLRTAVRYLYLGTLLQLEEHNLLRYDRSRTNREYLRSVAHLPELAAILREVVDVFDRVWYGYQSIDEASFQQYAARVAQLRQLR